LLRKGQLLKELRDTEQYKKLGDGGYQSWDSFLSNPELKISRSYSFQMIQLFEFVNLELHLPVEEVEKIASIKLLRDCMYFINKYNLSNDQAMELIDKAKYLSYSDFFKEADEMVQLQPGQQAIIGQVDQEKIGEVKTEKKEVELSHTAHIDICTACGKDRIEYYEDNICNCNGVFHLINKSLQRDYQHM